MGYDLYGVRPKNPDGEYFRNSATEWSGLLNFCDDIAKGVLTEEDFEKCGFNDGYLISRTKAEKLAKILKKFILSKSNQLEYEMILEKRGFRPVSSDSELCWINDYCCFSWDNVKNFIKFLEDCGGFRVY